MMITAFLLSVEIQGWLRPKTGLRAAFNPDNFRGDLQAILDRTETLGRTFRPVAEIGQLIPKRTYRGPTPAKASSWNGSLLYSTLRQYEPEHPLVGENIRGVMRDMMDVDRAAEESARIFETPWEVFRSAASHSLCAGLYLPHSAAKRFLRKIPTKRWMNSCASLYDEWGDEAA